MIGTVGLSMFDPEFRADFIEKNGIEAYNAALREHLKHSTVAVVNGHAIRIVKTERFGTLYAVVGTNLAFPNIERATKHAQEMQP